MDLVTKPVLSALVRLFAVIFLYLALALLYLLGSYSAFAGGSSVKLGQSFKLDHADEQTMGGLSPAADGKTTAALPNAGITHAPAVLFTPDGGKLFTGTSSGELAIFRASDRKLLSRKQIADGEVTALSFDAHGNTLAALTKDGMGWGGGSSYSSEDIQVTGELIGHWLRTPRQLWTPLPLLPSHHNLRHHRHKLRLRR